MMYNFCYSYFITFILLIAGIKVSVAQQDSDLLHLKQDSLNDGFTNVILDSHIISDSSTYLTEPDSSWFYVPKEFSFISKENTGKSRLVSAGIMPMANSAYDSEMGAYRLFFYVQVKDETHSCDSWSRFYVRYSGGDYQEFAFFDFGTVDNSYWSTFTTDLYIPVGKVINGLKLEGRRRRGVRCKNGPHDTNEFTGMSSWIYPGRKINIPSDFAGASSAIGAYYSTVVATYYPWTIKLFRTDNVSNQNYLPENKKITYKVNKNFEGGKFYWYYKIGTYGTEKIFPGNNPGNSYLTFCGNDIRTDYLNAIKQGQSISIRAKAYDGGRYSDYVTIDVPLEAPRINLNTIQKVNPLCSKESSGSIKVTLSRSIRQNEVLKVALQGINSVVYYEVQTIKPFASYIEFKNIPAGNYTLRFLEGTYPNSDRPTYVGDPVYHTYNFILSDPPELSLEKISTNNVHCWGGKDGRMSFIPKGGSGTLSVVHNNTNLFVIRNEVKQIIGLSEGIYPIKLRDGNGCFLTEGGKEKIWEIKVAQPEAVSVYKGDAVMPTGAGRKDGYLSVIAEKGTPGYSYLWQQGNTPLGYAVQQSNLGAGEYQVTVKDANYNLANPLTAENTAGCQSSLTLQLGEPQKLVVNVGLVSPVSCHDYADGILQATASGGVGRFEYQWQVFYAGKWVDKTGRAASYGQVDGLKSDTYRVLVWDEKDNRDTSASFQLPQPLPLVVRFNLVQPLCFGGTDGKVEAFVAGGNGGFDYKWDGSAVKGSIITGKAGNYRMTVKDSKNCTLAESVILSQPTPLTASYDMVRPSSDLSSDGSIVIHPSGGSPGYNYKWTYRNATSNPLTGIPTNGVPYHVVITDAHRCALNLEPRLIYPLEVKLQVKKVVSCKGVNDGLLEAFSTWGVSRDYKYQWYKLINGSFVTLSGVGKVSPEVGVGQYRVRVTDNENNAVTKDITLGEPSQLVASIKSVVPSSALASDGSITVVASGGTPGYSYVWNYRGATGNHLSNIPADSTPYRVVVSDAYGCRVSIEKQVLYPLGVTLGVKGAISCNGRVDGRLEAFPEGGQSRHYVYEWYKFVGGRWNQISGNGKISVAVGTGVYQVKIRDTQGKVATADFTLTEPSLLTAVAEMSFPSGPATPDGKIIILASGGTPGYTYQWEHNNATINPLIGIPAKNTPYRVTIRDARRCEVRLEPVLLFPLRVKINVKEPISCQGMADARLEAVAQGGLDDDYRYEWSKQVNGVWAVLSRGNKISPVVGPGKYRVMVTDRNDSIAIAEWLLTEPLRLTANFDTVCPSAATSSDGQIRIHPLGGTPYSDGSYRYAWDYQHATVNPLMGIPADSVPYRVIIKDAHQCQVELNVRILYPLKVRIEVKDPVSCNGRQDGCLKAVAEGGVSRNYSYLWYRLEDGVFRILPERSVTLGSIGKGTYQVKVRDSERNEATVQFVLNEPFLLTATFDTVCPSTALASDGMITIYPTGGTPDVDGFYRYEWDYNHSTVNPLSGIPADSVPYHVVVKDTHGCEVELNPRIIYPLGVTILVKDSISCYAMSDGILEAVSEGGVSRNYTYQWYHRVDGVFEKISAQHRVTGNLNTGEYQVKIWDAENNEAVSMPLLFGEPDSLRVKLKRLNPACKNDSNGWLEAMVEGGTLPYQYDWKKRSGRDSNRWEGLKQGAYEVRIVDRRGCEVIGRDTLVEPDSLMVKPDVRFPSVYGGNDGMIRLGMSGGTKPYAYRWEYDGTTLDWLAGLAASEVPYRVSITDAHGCVVVDTPKMYNPLIVSIDVRDSVSCYGRRDGKLAAVVAGGVGGPHLFEWYVRKADEFRSLGLGDSLLLNVDEGVYVVRARDRADSIAVSSAFTFRQPDSLQLHFVHQNPKCYEDKDGWTKALVEGGVGPYGCLWTDLKDEDKPVSFYRDGLGKGVYSLLITDRRGCRIEGVDTLTEPDRLVVRRQVDFPSVYGGDDGVISLIPAGGTGPYSYFWDYHSATENPLMGLAARNLPYDVTVTDAHGCQVVDTPRMYNPVTAMLTESGVIICSGDANAELTVHVKGGVGAPYRYEWYAVDGSWSARFPGEDSLLTEVGVGTYRVAVIDREGNMGWSIDHTVVSPDSLRLVFDIGNLPCKYDHDGWLEAIPRGGEGPYHIQWAKGDTLRRIENLDEGFYEVKMTDKRGCFVTRRPQVASPDELVLHIDFRAPLAWQGTDGAVWVKARGGSQPYSYLWKERECFSDTLCQIPAGSYEVTVSDQHGCRQTISTMVTQPPVLKVRIIMGRVISCFGIADGKLGAVATGGAGSIYKYEWFRIVNKQRQYLSAGIFCNGLDAGLYQVKVTDQNGISAWSDHFELTQPKPLQAGVQTGRLHCKGGQDGRLEVDVQGGTAPYQYYWSCGSVGTVAEDLAEGYYQVSVVDAHHCRTQAAAMVTSPDSLRMNAHVEVPLYYGGTGSIALTVIGGSVPYVVTWGDGERGMQREKLFAGNYQVEVKDTNGCVLKDQFIVKEPALLVAEIICSRIISCHGREDGSLEALASGGVGAYHYDWYHVNGSEVKYLSSGIRCNNLSSGTYRVKVTDGNKISAWSADYILVEPDPLKTVVIGDTLRCHGDSDGSVAAVVTGGTAPYEYLWTCGDTTPEVGGLIEGRYLVVVTDAHRCRTEVLTSVTAPASLQVEGKIKPIVCLGERGGISLTVSGGGSPYLVKWEDGSDALERAQLSKGIYPVEVRDAKGCFQVNHFELTEPEKITIDLGEERDLCRNQQEVLRPVDRTDIREYKWYHDGIVFDTTPFISVTDGGVYRLEVKTTKGCSGSGEVKVNQDNAEIDVNFAMASEVEEGNLLEIINTSLPMPEYSEWILPSSAGVSVVKENKDLLELIIEQTGEYTIGLKSVIGKCEAVLYKNVTVVLTGKGQPVTRASEHLIGDIQVWPNPNDGNFRVRVSLGQKANGLLRLYALTGILVRQFRCEGHDNYEFDFNETLPVGVYILHLVFGTEREAIKIVVE